MAAIVGRRLIATQFGVIVVYQLIITQIVFVNCCGNILTVYHLQILSHVNNVIFGVRVVVLVEAIKMLLVGGNASI